MKFIFQFFVERDESILSFLYQIKASIDWEQHIKKGKLKVSSSLDVDEGISLVNPSHSSFVGVKYRLKKGQVVTYDPRGKIPEPPVNLDFIVIYQDDSLVVIDKPTPLPIHPTGTYFKHTLTENLKRQGCDWLPLHRIDSETSGLLLLTTKKALVKQWSQSLKEAQKIYLVLVDGETPKRFKVEMPLGRRVLPGGLKEKFEERNNDSWVHKKRGENQTGKDSLTHFYRVQRYVFKSKSSNNVKTLLFALPKTGRTHQIRAHLSESDYPVVGDKIYGKDERYFIEFLKTGYTPELLEKLELPRQFLHAYKTTLVHPVTGKRLILKAPLPKELTKFLKKAVLL